MRVSGKKGQGRLPCPTCKSDRRYNVLHKLPGEPLARCADCLYDHIRG